VAISEEVEKLLKIERRPHSSQIEACTVTRSCLLDKKCGKVGQKNVLKPGRMEHGGLCR
jgi:hypothetical protein